MYNHAKIKNSNVDELSKILPIFFPSFFIPGRIWYIVLSFMEYLDQELPFFKKKKLKK